MNWGLEYNSQDILDSTADLCRIAHILLSCTAPSRIEPEGHTGKPSFEAGSLQSTRFP